MVEALISESIKRDISSKALKETKREVAGGNKTKVTVSIVDAISSDDAKKIVKEIKELKLKVQASIRGDVVRVEGKAIDDLQEAIKAIRGCDFDFPVNFTNLTSNTWIKSHLLLRSFPKSGDFGVVLPCSASMEY